MEKFKRLRITNDEPIISLRDNKFYFSSVLCRLAELNSKDYVVYHIDVENRQIGFDFTIDRADEDAYRLIKGTGKRQIIRSSAGEMISKFHWVKAIHHSNYNELKRHVAIKRGNLWIITLKPTFENKIRRSDLNKIPNGSKGIYRYTDTKNEIVYIGKGDIKTRAKDSERVDWNFSHIEYSLINDESKQFEWEDYWLTWYKEVNSDRLPYYNKIAGQRK
jgi:hypothetical protein